MPIYSLPNVDQHGVLAIHSEPKNRLGEYFCDNDNNRLWVYLRADEALSKGVGLVPKAVSSITSAASADAGSNVVDFAATVDLDGLFPRCPHQPRNADYMLLHAGNGDFGTIWEYTTRRVQVQWFSRLDFKLSAALVTTTVNITVPWLVREAAAASSPMVIGFTQREIPLGSYFWALVEGIGGTLLSTATIPHTGLDIANTEGETDMIDAASISDNIGFTLATGAANTFSPFVAAAPVRIGILPFQGNLRDIAYEHPSV